ncbi:MAG TPA: hypothetical protein VMR06_05310 [Dokdonella sp.]|uniref:hypothetical protein n=1 Tax=Dokdonella sp. TaxID=2291710 RepID=UPI002CAAD2E6|nr:hypothetical protein [Dokdonella sp.]HUD41400.1 hypothetical protein [Dokdonella sp.]
MPVARRPDGRRLACRNRSPNAFAASFVRVCAVAETVNASTKRGIARRAAAASPMRTVSAAHPSMRARQDAAASRSAGMRGGARGLAGRQGRGRGRAMRDAEVRAVPARMVRTALRPRAGRVGSGGLKGVLRRGTYRGVERRLCTMDGPSRSHNRAIGSRRFGRPGRDRTARARPFQDRSALRSRGAILHGSARRRPLAGLRAGGWCGAAYSATLA